MEISLHGNFVSGNPHGNRYLLSWCFLFSSYFGNVSYIECCIITVKVFKMLCISTQSRHTFHTILSSGVSTHFIVFKKRAFTSNALNHKTYRPFFDGYAFSIELIKITRGKDKATIQGFVYTFARSTGDIQQWVCDKRGVCKARMHSRNR